MTKKDAITKLTMLKLKYGDGLIPLIGYLSFNKETVGEIETVAELAHKNYLEYEYDRVTDDEGITHGFQRGYKLSYKAIKLLEEASK